MAKSDMILTSTQPKTLLLGIEAPYNSDVNADSYFEEFLNLAKTANIPLDYPLSLRLRTIDSSYFLTSGKLDEVKDFIQREEIERVVLSEPLSPQQARNLEDYLDCPIIDRTELILEIFENAAHSAEGKAQVAIARLQHEKTRLAGKGKHLAQQEGVVGLRGGPGETLKERERRHIENAILKLKKQLAQIERTRDTQRKQRLQSRVPLLCLIGYTNAGKSTILNALTKSNVLAEDKLFATLDTTTKELYIKSAKKGLLSDTVGFIQRLPTKLIEAFKSTLAELHFASLLLHVVDLSDPNWEAHITVVREILDDLGVSKNVLYVFNKMDRVDNLRAESLKCARYQPHVIISAQNKSGLEPLIDFLSEWEPETE